MKRAYYGIFCVLTSLSFISCKTQYALKHKLYTDVSGVEKDINNKILKNFGQIDTVADHAIDICLNTIDNETDSVKCKNLRKHVRLYVALAKKIILLHRDTNNNYAALGGVLSTYTQSTVNIKEKLLVYRLPKNN